MLGGLRECYALCGHMWAFGALGRRNFLVRWDERRLEARTIFREGSL